MILKNVITLWGIRNLATLPASRARKPFREAACDNAQQFDLSGLLSPAGPTLVAPLPQPVHLRRRAQTPRRRSSEGILSGRA